MSEFMESLDSRLPSATFASSRLRLYVERIDQFTNQSQHQHQPSRLPESDIARTQEISNYERNLLSINGGALDQQSASANHGPQYGDLWDLSWIFTPMELL
jgi:hypothetical protein